MAATPLYRAIVLELERRRQSVGISMERMSELMGTAERSYSKLLYADSPSGRVAQWETLQLAVDVLFCEGFKLFIEHSADEALTPAGVKRKVLAEASHWNRASRRQYLREIGRKGAQTTNEAVSPEERALRARRAAHVRWQRLTAEQRSEHGRRLRAERTSKHGSA